MFSDQTEIFQHRLSLWTQQTILARELTLHNDHKAIANLLNNPKSKVILQIECMILRLQGHNFNLEIC